MSTPKKNKIRLPHNFEPRTYQLPVLQALDAGFKRVVWVAHRRSGKDKTFINYTAKAMYERVGNYYYIFPTYKQAKKVIWNGMDRDGYKFTDHFPEAIRKRTDNTDMLIETLNGSMFQLVGSDNIDSLMGANPVGCVFSEWPLQNPAAWDFLRPILAENNGWAAFIYTPRGKNHGYTTLKIAEAFPDIWYSEVLTALDTNAIPQRILEQERREIMLKDGNDALYQQEYMCNFDVPIQGAYYAKQLMLADEEGRIAGVPHDTATVVHTAWDLGIDDSMSIWFFQAIGKELHFIDYYESSGEGIAYYIKYLKERPYVYGTHYAPHDIKVRELTTGRTRLETAKSLGISFDVAAKLSVEDGIEAVRNVLNRSWFDQKKCEQGLSALSSYHKEWDEDNQVFRARPTHDWSSHGCLVGNTKVLTNSGEVEIKDINIGDYVKTPSGYKEVTNAGVTKMVDEILEVYTEDKVIRATPGHRFFTDRGIVYADALRYNDVIWTQNNHKPSSLVEQLLGYRKVETIIDRGLTGNISYYTGRFGRSITETFRRGTLFITKTAMSLTTSLKICPAFITQNIAGDILWNNTRKIQIGIKKQEIETLKNIQTRKKTNRDCGKYIHKPSRRPKNGIDQEKVGNGIPSTAKRLGRIGKHVLKSVSCVVKNTKHIIHQDQNIAQRVVKVELVSLKNEPVYDLTVKKDHCYFANGFLVSNSDAFRTFAVGYREKIKSLGAVEHKIMMDPYW